jgi:hypothetical protein
VVMRGRKAVQASDDSLYLHFYLWSRHGEEGVSELLFFRSTGWRTICGRGKTWTLNSGGTSNGS